MSEVENKQNITADHVEDEYEDAQVTTLADVTPKLTKPWFMYKHLFLLNFLLMAALFSNVVSGYDGSMMNGLQALPTWSTYFNDPDKHPTALGTMSNGMTIGNLITLPFVSFMLDAIGRRWCIIIGCVIVCVGAALQGGARNFGMFVAGRIIVGIGGIITAVASPPLLTECAFPTHRPVMTAMFNPSWPVGAVIAALVTWAPYNGSMSTENWAWRMPSLLQMAIPLFQIVLAFFGPESPRWLIAKGRIQEAEDFFTKYHAGGDRNHPIVSYEMAEIGATIEEEKLQSVGSWLQWFKGRPMIHRFFICNAISVFRQLSGNALVSYYLVIILNNAGITNALQQLRLNLGLTAVSLVSAIIMAVLVGYFRRRTLFLLGFGSMFIVYLIFTVISAVNAPHVKTGGIPDKSLGDGIIFMIALYQVVYNFWAPVTPTYVMEICPYSLRAKGSMLFNFAGNITSLFNNYVNPIAMEKITWRYYIVYVCWLVVEFAIAYFLFPETSGLDLEEVNKVFNDNLISGREAMEKTHRIINLEKSAEV